MSLWKRLKNLWALSELYIAPREIPSVIEKYFSKNQPATIVQDSPDTLLDNLDLS